MSSSDGGESPRWREGTSTLQDAEIRARRKACAVISFEASFCKFQTPSLWVSASRCMRHLGLTRTSNLRRRSHGRSDGVTVRMRRADAVDAKLKF